MNKKILSIILCLLLALTLVFAISCGGGDEPAETDTNKDTNTNTDTGATPPADTETDTGTTPPADTDEPTTPPEEAQKWTVTFVYGGSKENVVVSVEDGKTISQVIADAEAPQGYTFDGWFSGETQWTAQTAITSDLTLTPKFVGNTNLIQFNGNGATGGDMTAGQTMTTGEKGNLLKNQFSRTGYKFLGWALSENGEVVYADEAEFEMGTEMFTALYAAWEVVTYEISYDTTGGENDASNPTSYTVESVVTFKPATKAGWEFTGWTFFDNPIETTEGLTGGLSLVATWTREKHQITYENISASEHSNPAVVTVDDEIVLQTGARWGYTFIGWYSDKELTNQVTKIEKGTNGPITIYAKFEVTKYSIEYKVDENTTPATGNPDTYDVTTEATLNAPTYNVPGYEFDGWFIEGTDTKVEAITPNERAENLVLEAKFKLITYTITYSGADGLMPEDAVYTFTVESENITLPTIVAAGYTFNGWYADAEYNTPITEIVINKESPANVTVYAKGELTRYTITYVYPEGVDATGATVENQDWYAEALHVTFKDPEIPGYKLLGWYKDAELTTPITSTEGLTENITVYASMKAVVTQIGVNQIESVVATEGTDANGNVGANWGDGKQIFDGISDCNSPNWHDGVKNGWAGYTGATLTVTLDQEYYITSATLYYWSNWKYGQIIFYDGNDKEVARTGNEWKAEVAFNGTSGVPMELAVNNVNVKKIVFTATNNNGQKTLTFVELILKVGEAPTEETPAQ